MLPRPSMTPLPRIVIPCSFVNSIHQSRPDPQLRELAGAKIVPSNCNRRKRFFRISHFIPVVGLPGTQCLADNKIQKRRWGLQGTQTQLEQPKLILPPCTQQPMQPQKPAAKPKSESFLTFSTKSCFLSSWFYMHFHQPQTTF